MEILASRRAAYVDNASAVADTVEDRSRQARPSGPARKSNRQQHAEAQNQCHPHPDIRRHGAPQLLHSDSA
jgi:hypothetical protein